jgi:hypothetical protein
MKTMKTRLFFICLVYIFLFVSASLYGIGERTVILGGEYTWRMAESRTSITEIGTVRANPVLAISSAAGTSTAGYQVTSGPLGSRSVLTEPAFDLSFSFDERETGLYRDVTGNYRTTVSREVHAADRANARAGAGAALFNGSGAVTVRPQHANALFAPGNRIRDFTIEFWLYPLNMENGEQILTWIATNRDMALQRVHCSASRNKLNWSFTNFFTSTNGSSNLNIEFSGSSHLVPKTWSHHLVRFDATTGMIEYIVDGVSESIVYATPTKRENGEVFTPLAGSGGVFSLGDRFMGLIDEFKIHKAFLERSSVQKYAPAGGRIQTSAIDLGEKNSGVVRIDASGGRVGIRRTGPAISGGISSEYHENGRFRFSDSAEMNFFVRTSENPYLLNTVQWTNFVPGTDINGLQGRYVQIAVDFYPSADGETSPYLDQLRVVYMPGEPPMPPRNLTATAVDGGVLLRWRGSPSTNTAGYLVYYSSVRGELFGTDSIAGSSPVDIGNKNSFFIGGLKNGTLYYFRVAAYDYITGTTEYYTGEFSAEVTARPLLGLSLSDISMEAR